jgi:hypothetical protein
MELLTTLCCDWRTEQETFQTKTNKSVYEIYYGKQGIISTRCIPSNEIIDVARSEYGLFSLHELMDMVGKKNPNATIRVQDLMDIVQDANNLYDKEEKCTIGDDESDGYGKLVQLVEEYTDRYVVGKKKLVI